MTSTTSISKIVSVAAGLAMFASMALAVAPAHAQSVTFSRDLTIGSKGADVTALQSYLIAGGYSIPAGATGFFGSQTKAALAAYQAAVGITPAVGYFGPITRAKVSGSVATPGPTPVALCPNGMTLASNCSMAPGTTPAPQPLCPNGMTLASNCTTSPTMTPPPSTTGTEGSFTVKQGAQPANNTNVTSSTNVPVYGIEVKATGSNMVVDRADIEFAVTVGSSTINPSSFITSISAWDGSTLLKTMALSSADFTKDNNNIYYVRVTGIGFNVPKDATKTLTFSINTNGVNSVDTARVMNVEGYSGSTQNVRAIDGAGLNSYANADWDSAFTFTASNNATLTASANTAVTPKAQTIAVNTTDGVRGVTSLAYDLKSTIGNSNLTQVAVTTRTNGVSTSAPTAAYLYDGSTLLGSASVTVTSGFATSTFSNLNVAIAKDATKTLTVKYDFPSTAVGVASTSIITTSSANTFETADGTTKNVTTASTIVGNDIHLYADSAPVWTLVSTSNVATAGVVSVASSSLTGTIVLNVKAMGGTLTKPVAGDFTVFFASTTALTTNGGAGYSAANGISVTPSITVSPTDATIGDGSSYQVTIVGTLYSNNASFGSSQPLFMAINDIDSVITKASGSNTITNQNWGIDNFYTPTQQLTKGTL